MNSPAVGNYRDSVTSWLAAHNLCDAKLQTELAAADGTGDTAALTVACCGAMSAAVALAWVGRWVGEDKANELASLMRHYTDNGGDDFTLFNDAFDGVSAGEEKDSWQPNWTVRPGEYLQEWLDTEDVTVSQFATRSALDYNTIVGVLTGTRRINKMIAAGLTRVTGTPESFWLRAETKYRRDLAHGLIDSADTPG